MQVVTRPPPATTDYDVVVVGCRAAGAATAMLLARRGLRVALVDGTPVAPSVTLSTHALMRAGVVQLRRWGLLEQVIAAGTPALRRTVFHYGDATTTVTLKSLGGVDALYAPRRGVLDPILVDAAMAAGARLRVDLAATGVLRGTDGRALGVTGRDRRGGPFRLRAAVTIGADGLHSCVARAVEAPLEQVAEHASSFIHAHGKGLLADDYERFFAPGVIAGLIPTNDGATCVWVGTSSTRFRAELAGDVGPVFDQLLAEASPELARRVTSAGPTDRPRGSIGRPAFRRRPWGPGWALVGEAGHFIDPVSGSGTSDSLRDAELLADAIAALLDGTRSEVEAMQEYCGTLDGLSRRAFAVTEAIASYAWDTWSVQSHVRSLSAAMADEVEHLLALDARTSEGLVR